VVLVFVGAAIALLILGLTLLRQDEVETTAPMNAVRFWLGISAITAVLAICVLFVYALFIG
jgi:hypothetical protein